LRISIPLSNYNLIFTYAKDPTMKIRPVILCHELIIVGLLTVFRYGFNIAGLWNGEILTKIADIQTWDSGYLKLK